MHVMYWLIMLLIFKKQAVIFEAVRINFKCNGFVCVLSFFSVVKISGFLVLFCSFGRTLTFLLQWVAFRGDFFPKGFAEGLRFAANLETCFPISVPNLWLSILYFRPGQKEKNDFRHMRDLRLVHGSYKRPQLTRIDFLLHSTVRRTTNLSILMQEKKISSL